jgi:hypothetical protein
VSEPAPVARVADSYGRPVEVVLSGQLWLQCHRGPGHPVVLYAACSVLSREAVRPRSFEWSDPDNVVPYARRRRFGDVWAAVYSADVEQRVAPVLAGPHAWVVAELRESYRESEGWY